MNNRNDAQTGKETSDQASEASKAQTPVTTSASPITPSASSTASSTAGSRAGAAASPAANKSTSERKPNLKRKQANFATMSNLMNKLVVKLGLDQRLKEHALMYLWPSVVGETFATNSRCLFIDNERKLVVSVKDASVGQELSLLRREILRKMQIAAHNLGVKIEGIRFDMKHFHHAGRSGS